jgi:hypothetical protein
MSGRRPGGEATHPTQLSEATPALALLILTSVHHAFGAMIYGTPWRLHVMFAALPIALAIFLMVRTGNRLWVKTAAIVILVIPVMAIGIFEGGYNHLVKNAVYFIAGEPAARSLFSASAYEMPNDAFFEITGVAQFLLGLFAARGAFRMLREDSKWVPRMLSSALGRKQTLGR